MLNQIELDEFSRKLGLSAKATKYIEQVRSNPATRRVQSGCGNVTARYPSRKMGFVIQAESHKLELPFIYELEHAREVLEFYDQPPAIKLEYLSRSEKNVGVLHTPDFFLLRTDGAGWVECKPEEKLVELAEKMPSRYCRDENGIWRCPPGEDAAQEFGFSYEIRSSSQLNPTLTRNVRFLEDYFRRDSLAVEGPIREKIIRFVQIDPGLSMEALMAKFEGSNYESVYKLISTEELFVDLTAAPFTDPGRVRIYPDEATASAYQLICRNGFEISGAATHFDSPEKLNAKATEILKQASAEALSIANFRFELVRNPGLAESKQVDPRTVRTWQRFFREAETVYGCGYIGLLPKIDSRGNRKKRYSEAMYQMADQAIDEHYCSVKRKTKLETYGAFLLECEKQSLTAPSYQWFILRVDQRSKYKLLVAREGRRAAYRYETKVHGPNDNHGDRPWDLAHIDHTQADIELICDESDQNLGRPWLSVMLDGHSRKVLAFHLSFDPPSYRTCMMLVRECVKKHERLPSCIVVDGGKEFQSVYFETLAARCECLLKRRPPAKARFGSIIERCFGTVNTQFFYNLSGNTQNMKNVRQVTKSVNPKNHAVWTLERLHELLAEFFFTVYEHRMHPTLMVSPVQAYAKGMEVGGARETRRIAYDDNFIMLTLPTTTSGQAKVQPGMGVKIHYIHYWADDMRNPEIEGSKVPVRYDPFNLGVAYAYLNKRWVKCISEFHNVLEGRTEKQVMLATESLRKAKGNAVRSYTITAKRLAEFFVDIESEEKDRKQELKDQALQRIKEQNEPALKILTQLLPAPASVVPMPEEVQPAVVYEDF
jgi:putative transposase